MSDWNKAIDMYESKQDLIKRLRNALAERDALRADAERYRWLRSRTGLTLRSDYGTWTRPDGSKFTSTHYLAEGHTQHAPADSLDAAIDAARKEKT
jgi:hypothetical protein